MQDGNVRLSIVIPVYNVEGYISRCLESIIEGIRLSAQDESFEVILINDGSTDNSEVICLEYKNRFNFIKYYYQENKGLSGARNAGIHYSTGKYIVFVDSDDFINSDSLPKLLQQTVNDVDVCFLHAIKYFPDGTLAPFGERYYRDNIIGKGKRDVLKELTSFRKFPGSAWNKMVRREFLLKNNLFFIEKIYSEDLEWSIRLYNAAEIFSSIDGIYYYYSQGRIDSITGTISMKNVNALIYLLEKYSDFPFDKDIESSQISFLCYEYLVLLFLLETIEHKTETVIERVYFLRRVLSRADKISYRVLYWLVSIFGVKNISKIIFFLKNIVK